MALAGDLRHMRARRRGFTLRRMRNLFLVVHIVMGSVALGTMIVPLVARKGGRAHRRAGWVFVAGMAFATATAFFLSADRLLTDHTPGGRTFGLLLFYLSIVTASTVSAGMRVLSNKRRTTPSRNWWDLGMSASLAGSGVLAAVYGIAMRQPLFIGFSLIGILNGWSQLAYWLRPPVARMHWWYAHMGNMLGGCIAALTAFIVANAPHWGLPGDAVAVWLGPTAIGVPGIFAWIGYYRRNFEPRANGGVGGNGEKRSHGGTEKQRRTEAMSAAG